MLCQSFHNPYIIRTVFEYILPHPDYGNFDSAFMTEIRKMNQEIASGIIAQICQKVLVVDYDKYKETIDTDELKEYFIKREQERKEERTRIQSEYISIVKTRLAEVDSRI